MKTMFESLASACGRWLPGLLAVSALSGCANAYLHSEARQKQSEAAVKAWSEVDNAAPITTERENLNKLLQAEQATQQRVVAARRQFLAAVIVAPPEGEADKVKQSVAVRLHAAAIREFEALVGPVEAYDKQVDAARRVKPTNDAIENATKELKALGSPVTGCRELDADALPQPAAKDWLESLPKGELADATVYFETLVDKCKSLAKLASGETAPAAVQGTVLAKAVSDRRLDQRELVDRRATFAVAKRSYEVALGKYQVAEADAAKTPDDATLSARLGDAAKTLKAQIDALRGMNNALAQKFIANETLESIDTALGAIAAGDAGDDTRKGVIFAVQAPALIDRYRAAIAASKKPLALPLLIRRNAEQLQRDAAATDVRLLEAKLVLADGIVEAVHTQARALRQALRELDRAGLLDSKTRDNKSKPNIFERQLSWTEALEATDGPARQMLLSGAGRYLDAMSRLEGERYRLTYARISLDHERGLAYAETSVAQWVNLIGAGVGQLEAFGKGGIDGAVLSDIARVLGLVWIGNGVNK